MPLDKIDRKLIQLLVADSRRPLKDLAHAVGLSSPSVGERVKRLRERGVIRGFTVDVDPAAIGYAIQAIVRVRPLPGKTSIVHKLIQDTAQVSECDKITGEDCFVLRVFATSLQHLDRIVEPIAEEAATNTAIVKSKPVMRRPPALLDRTLTGLKHGPS